MVFCSFSFPLSPHYWRSVYILPSTVHATLTTSSSLAKYGCRQMTIHQLPPRSLPPRRRRKRTRRTRQRSSGLLTSIAVPLLSAIAPVLFKGIYSKVPKGENDSKRMGKTSVGNPRPLSVWGVQSGAGRVRARYVPWQQRRSGLFYRKWWNHA